MEGIPFLATSLSAGAVFLCFLHWRGGSRWLQLPALLALILSALLWVGYSGAEFGIVFLLLGLIATALLCILFNSDKQAAKPARLRATRWTYEPGSAGQLTTELVVASILAPLSSAGILIASVHFLPWTMPSKLALAALAFPLLWAVLSLAYRMLNRPRAYVAVLSVLSLLTLGVNYGV